MIDFRRNISHFKADYPNQSPRMIVVIHPSFSKEIIFEIDKVHSEHYSFTKEKQKHIS